MKKFWLVLLSLGLIVAFSTVSFAQVTVRNSGEFVAGGMYLNRTSVADVSGTEGLNTAFYFQRLRLNTTFIVHPGLFLMTRADIMERAWGAARSQVPLNTTNDILSAGTRAENENIAFDLVYLTYISPIGIISAGYQIDGAWGTVFGDNSMPTGKVGYTFRGGPITAGIQTGKNIENSRTAINPALAADRDSSFYTAFVVYAMKPGQVGFLAKFIDNRTGRGNVFPVGHPLAGFPIGTKQQTLSMLPYAKLQFGPVAVQAEVVWTIGKVQFEEDTQLTRFLAGMAYDEIKINALSGWVDATADLGMFYVGGTVAYAAGDDPGTADKIEGTANAGGIDWNPALILFNSDLSYWQGGVTGYGTTTTGTAFGNGYFFQVRGGVRPIEKLDLGLAVSYARADKVLDEQDRNLGIEVDVTATYKITNNLSYMLGVGYLMTGDYFKSAVVPGVASDITSDYLVLNKLTLTF